jgi:predicted glycogen debranching enzyme
MPARCWLGKLADKKRKASRLPSGLSFGADVCGNPERALGLEWFETNGLGGFASSSIIGANTRRYHGLLVAALNPPVGRIAVLSKLDETVFAPGGALEFGSNRYPGTIHPQGFNFLEFFHLDPFPRWIFRAGKIFLEKTVMLEYGANAVWVRYRWLGPDMKAAGAPPTGYGLTVRPLLAFRDYHQLAHGNDVCNLSVRGGAVGYTIRPYEGLPEMTIDTGADCFCDAPDWYYNFEYDIERERGLDFQEDLFSPGTFDAPADSVEWAIRFSLGGHAYAGASVEGCAGLLKRFNAAAAAEIQRRKNLLSGFESADSFSKRLALAADTFIVSRGSNGKTILAGYPWFTDWGRDTMISLPGLAPAAGRPEIARNILETFAGCAEFGLIPNRFPDGNESPAYNTVDAALWFVLAVDSYVRETGDTAFLEHLWPTLSSIIDSYRIGTINEIRMDNDGLISAGDRTMQLTWMDAKVGDWVVTPRHGKAVEINALWYNSLKAMARFAPCIGEDPAHYSELAELTQLEFESQFWNESKGCLYDVLREGEADPAVRPNQIFALSLPETLLDREKQESVLRVVEEKLLTPFGLRSLAPGEPGYAGIYCGGVVQRDGAYHQGTVWSWLIGPYVSAVLNVRGRGRDVAAGLAKKLEKLEEHLSDTGLNSISEIFDGDPPHHPRGCFAQAWSVAELLRVKKELNQILGKS